MKYLLLSLVFFFIQNNAAQNTYVIIRKANGLALQKKYTDAEVLYRKALEKDKKIPTAYYNTGNTQYLQNQYEIAIKQYEESLLHFDNNEDKAHAYHNIGNAYLSQKKYKEGIVAYKNALKLNPSDMDTKYNLVYAQEKLKKEQQAEKQEKKEKEQEEKQDQEQEQENKNENSKEEKEASNPDKPLPKKEGGMSKEEAEKLLNALQKQEEKLQEKLGKPEGNPFQIQMEKDW